MLTAPKRKKLKIPNFIFLTKWGVVPLKKVKIGEKCPKFYRLLKTGLVRDNLFVSSASRICELKKICSGFFKFAFEIKLYWKTRPHVNFAPFFGTKRWITLEQNNISKITNKVLENKQLRGSMPNSKANALVVWKLKGKKKIVKMNIEKRPVLCTTLYRKPMQPATLMAFYTNFATEFLHTVFTRRSVLIGTLRRDQKVIFVKSPISSHSDAISIPWCKKSKKWPKTQIKGPAFKKKNHCTSLIALFLWNMLPREV